MNWISRHRNESVAFLVSLGVHALVVARLGVSSDGDASRLASMHPSRPVAAALTVVAIASTAAVDAKSPDAAWNEPALAPAVPDREMNSIAPRSAVIARAPDAVPPPVDASIGFESSVEARLNDEFEVARLAALQRARDVNAAHIRARELQSGSVRDPRE